MSEAQTPAPMKLRKRVEPPGTEPLLVLDANIAPWVADDLRREGLDITSVDSWGLHSAPDGAIWERALAEEGGLKTESRKAHRKRAKQLGADPHELEPTREKVGPGRPITIISRDFDMKDYRDQYGAVPQEGGEQALVGPNVVRLSSGIRTMEDVKDAIRALNEAGVFARQARGEAPFPGQDPNRDYSYLEITDPNPKPHPKGKVFSPPPLPAAAHNVAPADFPYQVWDVPVVPRRPDKPPTEFPTDERKRMSTLQLEAVRASLARNASAGA